VSVRTTVYIPAAAVVAAGIVGFWTVDVKPFGPVHAYVAPVIVGEAVSGRGDPAQTGPPLRATTGGTSTAKAARLGDAMPGYPDNEIVGLPGCVNVKAVPWQPDPVQDEGDAVGPNVQTVVAGGEGSCPMPWRSAHTVTTSPTFAG